MNKFWYERVLRSSGKVTTILCASAWRYTPPSPRVTVRLVDCGTFDEGEG